MSTTMRVGRVSIIGTGVIGASWAALFLAKGLEVVATDIAPNAEAALKRFIATAWPALKRLGLAPGASQSKLTFTPDVAEAVTSSSTASMPRSDRAPSRSWRRKGTRFCSVSSSYAPSVGRQAPRTKPQWSDGAGAAS